MQDASDLLLNSSHPQGGNPMSDDRRVGVVGTDFRVHGTRNLFVADASVFPTSIHVNPQLTIMAMAGLAWETVIALLPLGATRSERPARPGSRRSRRPQALERGAGREHVGVGAAAADDLHARPAGRRPSRPGPTPRGGR